MCGKSSADLANSAARVRRIFGKCAANITTWVSEVIKEWNVQGTPYRMQNKFLLHVPLRAWWVSPLHSNIEILPKVEIYLKSTRINVVLDSDSGNPLGPRVKQFKASRVNASVAILITTHTSRPLFISCEVIGRWREALDLILAEPFVLVPKLLNSYFMQFLQNLSNNLYKITWGLHIKVEWMISYLQISGQTTGSACNLTATICFKKLIFKWSIQNLCKFWGRHFKSRNHFKSKILNARARTKLNVIYELRLYSRMQRP